MDVGEGGGPAAGPGTAWCDRNGLLLCVGDVVTRELYGYMPLADEWVDGTGPECLYDIVELTLDPGDSAVGLARLCDCSGRRDSGLQWCAYLDLQQLEPPWYVRLHRRIQWEFRWALGLPPFGPRPRPEHRPLWAGFQDAEHPLSSGDVGSIGSGPSSGSESGDDSDGSSDSLSGHGGHGSSSGSETYSGSVDDSDYHAGSNSDVDSYQDVNIDS